MNEAFRVEVRRPTVTTSSDPGADGEGDSGERVAVVELSGQLDRTAGEQMADVRSRAASGLDVVVLDLSRVSYINSTGIALLVGLLADARAASVEVRVCGLTDHYRHIFELTRLMDLMTWFPDEASAVTGTPPVVQT